MFSSFGETLVARLRRSPPSSIAESSIWLRKATESALQVWRDKSFSSPVTPIWTSPRESCYWFAQDRNDLCLAMTLWHCPLVFLLRNSQIQEHCALFWKPLALYSVFFSVFALSVSSTGTMTRTFSSLHLWTPTLRSLILIS